MLKSDPAKASVRRRKQMQQNYGEGHYARRWFIGIVAVIVLVAALALIGAVFTHYFYPTATTPYYGYPFYGWFFFPFGFIIFFFVIFFVARLIFWPMGWWGGRRRYSYRYGYGDSREILRRRYAMGEITKDQYDQMMRDLEQHT